MLNQNNTIVAQTIKFPISDAEFESMMRASLAASDIDLMPITDAIFIPVETTWNKHWMQECAGIDYAYQLLQREPRAKIGI
jgi:hypothetical protein